MPPKERKLPWELIISLAALIVSVSTFVFDKVERLKELESDQQKKLQTAFNLGDQIQQAYIVYTQVNQGDPRDVKRAKDDALLQFAISQAACKQFGIEVDLKILLMAAGDRAVFQKSFLSVVEDRIEERHGEEVAASFDLGARLVWLALEARITEGNKKQEVEFLDQYRQVVPPLNKDLSVLQISPAFNKNLQTNEEIYKAVAELKRRVIDLWNPK